MSRNKIAVILLTTSSFALVILLMSLLNSDHWEIEDGVPTPNEIVRKAPVPENIERKTQTFTRKSVKVRRAPSMNGADGGAYNRTVDPKMEKVFALFDRDGTLVANNGATIEIKHINGPKGDELKMAIHLCEKYGRGVSAYIQLKISNGHKSWQMRNGKQNIVLCQHDDGTVSITGEENEYDEANPKQPFVQNLDTYYDGRMGSCDIDDPSDYEACPTWRQKTE